MGDGKPVPPSNDEIAHYMRALGVDTTIASGFAVQQIPGGGRSSIYYWGVAKGKEGRGVQGTLDLSWQRKR